jgi:hypothetical protein
MYVRRPLELSSCGSLPVSRKIIRSIAALVSTRGWAMELTTLESRTPLNFLGPDDFVKIRSIRRPVLVGRIAYVT